MEPISAVSTLSAISKAAEAIEKILEEGSRLAKEDAEYYATHLEAALLAMRGLETGYIEILIQANQIDLDDSEQQKDLRLAITNYLYGEVLRPKLMDAIDRLEIGREALRRHASGLPFLPKVKDRNTALAKFDELMNKLRNYLIELGTSRGGSAPPVVLESLTRLEAALSGSPEAFKQLTSDLLMNLDKDNLLFVLPPKKRTRKFG
jgi:hypothetical protein